MEETHHLNYILGQLHEVILINVAVEKVAMRWYFLVRFFIFCGVSTVWISFIGMRVSIPKGKVCACSRRRIFKCLLVQF